MNRQDSDRPRRKKLDAGIKPSILLFLAEVLVLTAAFVVSYLFHGEADLWISLFGFADLFLAAAGIVVSAGAIKKQSEPAGLVIILLILHILQILLIGGIYVLGILTLL